MWLNLRSRTFSSQNKILKFNFFLFLFFFKNSLNEIKRYIYIFVKYKLTKVSLDYMGMEKWRIWLIYTPNTILNVSANRSFPMAAIRRSTLRDLPWETNYWNMFLKGNKLFSARMVFVHDLTADTSYLFNLYELPSDNSFTTG